jgi:hypothetical protein
VFTDSPFPLTQAESDHRGHAVVEQVFADLIDGPWAHLPSAAFNANAACTTFADRRTHDRSSSLITCGL